MTMRRVAGEPSDNSRGTGGRTGTTVGRRRDSFDQTADTHRAFDESGRILRDNVYGNIDEDVWRRDFTANSLYYNIADFSIWDYVNGAADIAARTLRMIGDPETRYREDPVRMLRAARFEAKLGFTLDPATAAPIAQLAELLGGVPPARLFDETLKLFLTGHGARSYEVLRRRGLLAAILPTVDYLCGRVPGQPGGATAGAGAAQYRRTGGRRQSRSRRPFCSHCCCTGPLPASSRPCRRSTGMRPVPFWTPVTRPCARRSRGSPFRVASRWACARCLRCSRAWSIRADGGRCGCWSIRASVPPMTCCCCARSWVWRPRTWLTGGPACRRSRTEEREAMADDLGGSTTAP